MTALVVGDLVMVSGGYEGNLSTWLAGGGGYAGRLVAIVGPAAAVELDSDLELGPGEWQDFGEGSMTAIGTVSVARGRWLVLLQGWVGGTWSIPTGRLHVGVCEKKPALETLPPGGGIGVWVESHATMTAR
jgi:hypothetical protein